MIKLKFIFCLIAIGILTDLKAQEPKPLQHILLFNWTAEASENQKKEVLDLFHGLAGKVEGMQRTSVKNIIKSSEKFDVAIFITFENETALEAYEKHPDHIKISRIAPPLLTEFSVFDFYGTF